VLFPQVPLEEVLRTGLALARTLESALGGTVAQKGIYLVQHVVDGSVHCLFGSAVVLAFSTHIHSPVPRSSRQGRFMHLQDSRDIGSSDLYILLENTCNTRQKQIGLDGIVKNKFQESRDCESAAFFRLT
ncbi:hypothetical protein Celaphus_00009544, partial [Cervus elaphus hippelaphus]